MTDTSTQCPECKKAFVPEAKSPARPFCSDQCKLADLHRWLNELGLSEPGEDESPSSQYTH